MIPDDYIHQLKTKLQSLGPLRPEAWLLILAEMKQKTVKVDESFNRSAGQLAYLASGLLKEYAANDRDRPSIINFIPENAPLISNKFNQRHYLKACATCLIFYWNQDSLWVIYQQYAELKPVYEALCYEYDSAVAFRNRLLEIHETEARISLLLHHFPEVVKLVKKKDMANYVHVSYPHFVKVFNKS